MQLLPQMQSLAQLSVKWASILNPLLSNPATNPSILQNVVLTVGANSVPHKLGRNLQGWYITRYQGGYSEIYDLQNQNSYPDLNLNLHSSAAVTVDIAVF